MRGSNGLSVETPRPRPPANPAHAKLAVAAVHITALAHPIVCVTSGPIAPATVALVVIVTLKAKPVTTVGAKLLQQRPPGATTCHRTCQVVNCVHAVARWARPHPHTLPGGRQWRICHLWCRVVGDDA